VPVGLVPLQCWGLETLGAADLWSVSLLVRTRPDLDVGRLRAALGAVVARHPGLRLRVFRDAAGRWRAETRAGRGAAFRTVDLAGVDQADRAAAISRVAGAERRGLDLDRGPALRVACLGSPGSWQVLFVVNHLAFDAFCWSILLEDLAAAYHDVPAYEARHGAAEDDEYAAWTGRLAARARSEAGRAAAEYWCGDRALRAPELPADDPDAPLLDGRTVTVPVSLPPDVTAALVARLKREPGVDMQLALTAAVHRAVEPWSGERRMGMWFLNHGRTSAVATPRTLRLIGFVAYSYPVVLDPAPDGGDVLRLAADLGRQVAAVPHGGLDYETSRYLGDDALCERMAAVRLPGILLNYVGQVRRSLPGPLFTDIDHDVSIQVRDPNAARTLDLEVEASVRDGSLHTVWKYVRDRHREATVAALTRRFREVLLEVAGT